MEQLSDAAVKYGMRAKLAMLLGVVLSVGAIAAEKPFGIWCNVDGKQLELIEAQHAAVSRNGALSLGAGAWTRPRPFKMLSMTLPGAQAGKQRLADTPGMQVIYSRDMLSSDSRDGYAASRSAPDTAAEVTLSRLGTNDNIVEGTFWAKVASLGTQPLLITNGIFRLRLTNEAKNN